MAKLTGESSALISLVFTDTGDPNAGLARLEGRAGLEGMDEDMDDGSEAPEDGDWVGGDKWHTEDQTQHNTKSPLTRTKHNTMTAIGTLARPDTQQHNNNSATKHAHQQTIIIIIIIKCIKTSICQNGRKNEERAGKCMQLQNAKN